MTALNLISTSRKKSGLLGDCHALARIGHSILIPSLHGRMDSGRVLLQQEHTSGLIVEHRIDFSDSEEDSKYIISQPSDSDIGHLVVTSFWPSPNRALAVLHVSKDSVFLEALCDQVFLQAQTWVSPSAGSTFPLVSIPPTENNRQTLSLLRPDDVFSVEDIHFHFESSPPSSSKAISEHVQVKSSGHGPSLVVESQMAVRDNTYNLSTIRTEHGQAAISSLAPVASMLKDSENTISGIAMSPSFAEETSAIRLDNDQTRDGEEDSLFIPMNVADSIEVRTNIAPELSPDHRSSSNLNNGVSADSIAVKTTPPTSSETPSSEQPEAAAAGCNPVAGEERISHSLGAVVKDTFDQGMAVFVRSAPNNAEVDKVIDDAIAHDHTTNSVNVVDAIDVTNAGISSGSSQPNGYLDLTAAEEQSPFLHPAVDVNNVDAVIDKAEQTDPQAALNTLTQQSPEVMMLTPAATNPQVQPAGIEIRPPVLSDEVYDELNDEELSTAPDAKKAKTRGVYQHGESQQDSMRSTVHMERNPFNKKNSSRKRKYSNKARGARRETASGSISSETQNSTAQTTPESPTTAAASPISSSTRSTRSTSSRKPIEGYDMRIYFASSTTVQTRKDIKDFLKTSMIRTVKSPDKCTHFCVGSKGELKKTSNVVKAVMNGNQVTIDKWLTDSAAKGSLLDPNEYLPDTPSEWNIDLAEAIQCGREGVSVLKDHLIFFTEDAKEALGDGYEDVRTIVLSAGAVDARCVKRANIKGGEFGTSTIYIAKGEDDLDLDQCLAEGLKVFNRDIVLMSILRGKLDLDSDEFVVREGNVDAKGGQKKKRKRKRQS